MKFKYYPALQLPVINENSDYDNQNEEFKSSRINDPYGFIRIQSLEIYNFKGVRHGYIELFPIGKNQSSDRKSNILALYGQNGSGKTTVIQALYLVKQVMMGEELSDEVDRLISQGTESAEIKVVFEYRRKGEDTIEYLTYSFSFIRMNDGDDNETGKVGVRNEVLSLCKRDKTGKLTEKTHKLFDTNSSNKVLNASLIEVDVRSPYDPSNTRKERFKVDEYDQVYSANREDAIECGASVLFYQGLEFTDLIGFGSIGDEDEAYVVFPNRYAYIDLLKSFAEKYLFIAGANLFNAFSDNAAPLLLRRGYVETHQDDEVTSSQVLYIARCLVPLNKVLSAIVPGLRVEIEADYKPEIRKLFEGRPIFEEIIDDLNSRVHKIMASESIETLRDYDEGNLYANLNNHSIDYIDKRLLSVRFFSRRGDIVTPLEDESEGIKHIIYDLDLFIAAYNDPGVTVAIDEFDAGVFEYLLGEMLKTFEQHGKGQLIFTSHNLRPLEVLDRSFICFTTTNPENRYLRMKYINQTNNLRDVYYRQILVGEQDEDLYDYVNSFELMEALDWAGEGNEQSET